MRNCGGNVGEIRHFGQEEFYLQRGASPPDLQQDLFVVGGFVSDDAQALDVRLDFFDDVHLLHRRNVGAQLRRIKSSDDEGGYTAAK